jgi:hypothetical protein
MLPPFNPAIWELYPHGKAISCFWQAINHSSDLRKFPRQRGNQRLFTGLPGPLADYTRTVGTDVFGKCSFSGAVLPGLRGRWEVKKEHASRSCHRIAFGCDFCAGSNRSLPGQLPRLRGRAPNSPLMKRYQTGSHGSFSLQSRKNLNLASGNCLSPD